MKRLNVAILNVNIYISGIGVYIGPQTSSKFSKSHLESFNKKKKKNLYKSCGTPGYSLCARATETPGTTSWFISPQAEKLTSKVAA